MAKHWVTKTVVIGVAVLMMGMSANAIAGMGRGGMGGGGMWGINSSQPDRRSNQSTGIGTKSIHGIHTGSSSAAPGKKPCH